MPRDPQGAETRRVTFEVRDAFIGDHTTHLMRVRLAFGWEFEASVAAYRRWRLVVIGGGLHLGEPWGEEGALWSLNLRVYSYGICIGFRAPAPPQPEHEDWDSAYSGETPIPPHAGEETKG